jgi:hypothetical protein
VGKGSEKKKSHDVGKLQGVEKNLPPGIIRKTKQVAKPAMN